MKTYQDIIKERLLENSLGFEGDEILKNLVFSIIKKEQINFIVETGTFYGATTKHFANWVDYVISVENNPIYYAKAKENMAGINNAYLYFNDSVLILNKLYLYFSQNIDAAEFNYIPKPEKIFYFLDAHWGNDNPLLNEIYAIGLIYKTCGIKPIIAIHDFKVPGHPELGFDVYGNIVYEWSYIENSIKEALDKYEISYNSEAIGAKRGVIFIFAK